MKAILASVKLFVVTNLVCAIFMFVTTMLFLLSKKKDIVNVFPSIVKMHTNPYQSYRKHAT
jgi:folate-dependent phosphoribosylglycinamide formyltransferase PurN